MSQYVSDNLSDEVPHIWRFALRLTRSETLAEDLVQKTAVRSLERRHQFETGSTLRSWLYSIMHSIWKNELRAKAVRQYSNFSLDDTEAQASEACQGELQLLFREVMHQVNQLPEAQRTVMLLVCTEGYSYQEAADILDIPVGTIMSRLARARLIIGQAFIDNEKDGICLSEKTHEN